MITLDMHICDQRRGYRVVFEGDGPEVEVRAIEFIQARWSTHVPSEPDDAQFDVNKYEKLYALLYPQCEHGLSESNCYGPQHYYFDEDEQARGMHNGW